MITPGSVMRLANASGHVMLLLVTAATIVLVAGPSAAEEPWQAALRLQLDAERKCQVETFVSIRQLPPGTLEGLDGRVRCYDGREFDFTRDKPHLKFDIRQCQPAVC